MNRKAGELCRAVRGRLIRGRPDATARGVCTDSRTLSPGELFVALSGDRFDGHGFVAEVCSKGAAGAVVHEGRPASGAWDDLRPDFFLIAVKEPLQALGDLAAAVRSTFQGPVVAITGSNGKTTTKEMVAGILSFLGPVLKNSGNLNNLVGLPLTLFRLAPEHRYLVLEMGANAFGEIKRLAAIARPTVGLITNIGPAHLEGFGSLEGVARAKGELLPALPADGTFVLNADDPRLVETAKGFQGNTVTFSRRRPAAVRLKEARIRDNNTTVLLMEVGGRDLVAELSGTGEPLEQNALAAAAAAWAAGSDMDAVRNGLRDFRPLEGRTRLLELPRNIRVLDDAYNANPASMEAALNTLVRLKGHGRILAVLGEMAELGEETEGAHYALGLQTAARNLDEVFFVGPHRGMMRHGAVDGGMDSDRIHGFASVESLLEVLPQAVRPGDVLLIKASRVMRMERVLARLKEDD